MAKRDRHDVMTDPRALHLVGGSKSNSKISNFFLLYAELRNSPTGEFGPGTPGNSAERRHVGNFNLRCLDVHEQVSHARQFPHGPDVQLGRGDPLRDPQSRFSV